MGNGEFPKQCGSVIDKESKRQPSVFIRFVHLTFLLKEPNEAIYEEKKADSLEV